MHFYQADRTQPHSIPWDAVERNARETWGLADDWERERRQHQRDKGQVIYSRFTARHGQVETAHHMGILKKYGK